MFIKRIEFTIALFLLSFSVFGQLLQFELNNESARYGCSEKVAEFIITQDTCPANHVCEYAWSFGDGETAIYYTGDTVVSHLYNEDGKFSVSLTVTDTSDFTIYGTASKQDIVTIYDPGEAAIDFEQFESDSAPYFSFQYRFFPDFDSDHNGLWEYSWDFGNGLTADSDTAEVIYEEENLDPGYEVILTTRLITKRLEMSSDDLEKYGLTGCSATEVKNQVVLDDYFANPEEEIISNRKPLQPNIFTPNDDGENDLFFLNTNGEDLFSFYIYNRWGALVFEKENSLTIEWSGVNMASEPVATGTYFYIVVSDKVDGRHEMKGSVSLIR